MEQASRHWHGQETVHRDAARGESKDRDVVGIASKCRDVLLYPLEGSNLVHVGVVALGLFRMLAAQRGKGKESEPPYAVIGCDQDDALFSELSPRG